MDSKDIRRREKPQGKTSKQSVHLWIRMETTWLKNCGEETSSQYHIYIAASIAYIAPYLFSFSEFFIYLTISIGYCLRKFLVPTLYLLVLSMAQSLLCLNACASPHRRVFAGLGSEWGPAKVTTSVDLLICQLITFLLICLACLICKESRVNFWNWNAEAIKQIKIRVETGLNGRSCIHCWCSQLLCTRSCTSAANRKLPNPPCHLESHQEVSARNENGTSLIVSNTHLNA